MAFNPRKAFNFRLEIEGIDVASVQEVSGIGQTIGKVTHGAGNSEVYTAGMVKANEVTFKKLRTLLATDNILMRWMKSVQNPKTGTGSFNYKKTVILKEYNHAGIALDTWILYGCFPINFDLGTLSKTADENVISSMVLSVDSIELLGA